VATYPEGFVFVRGSGLMLGLKCKPAVGDVVNAGYEAGVIVVPAADNVARLLPALTLSDDEIDEAMARLGKAAQALTLVEA
jgi:acetylornithine/N-succinyldiaminopimelate aminotransferase